MKNILMIIPPERFRDEELFETKEELEKFGHKISIASTHIGKCPGSRGGFAYSDFDINEIDTDVYDSVIFVGGGGSKLLFNNEIAINIAKEMYNKGRIVAAICLAPVILANAGILAGKKATVVYNPDQIVPVIPEQIVPVIPDQIVPVIPDQIVPL